MGFWQWLFGDKRPDTSGSVPTNGAIDQQREFQCELDTVRAAPVTHRRKLANMLATDGLAATFGEIKEERIRLLWSCLGFYTPEILERHPGRLTSNELCLRFIFGRAVEEPDPETRSSLALFFYRFHLDWSKNATNEICKHGIVGFPIYGMILPGRERLQDNLTSFNSLINACSEAAIAPVSETHLPVKDIKASELKSSSGASVTPKISGEYQTATEVKLSGRRVSKVEVCFSAPASPYEERDVLKDLFDYFSLPPYFHPEIQITTCYGTIRSAPELFVVARSTIIGFDPDSVIYMTFNVDSVFGVLILEIE